ncbi:MAG: sensor histidine kinase [Candidatus Cohnella colombiensis]|uniref:Sensor histidine kinase n=1 Tax=Candidatus Cohnella colombiensis TaxID=3121368 RepID=A0AA95JG85_9BACL|nr:MAG: sensor histidine kinase [Cohnella sp.]
MDKIRQAQLSMAVKTKDQLDYFAKNTLSFSNYIFLNPSVQAMVTNDEPQLRDQVLKTLLPLMVTGESIQSLILYPFPKSDSAVQPFVITHTGIAGAISFAQFQKTKYFERYNASPEHMLWDLIHPSDHVLTGDYHYKLALIKPYKNYYNYEQSGLIVVGMDADRLSHTLFHESDDAVQFIMNDNGIILAATDLSWIGKSITQLPVFPQSVNIEGAAPSRAFTQLKETDELIVSDSISELTGWHTVVIQDRSKLLAELEHIGSVTLTIMLIVGFFSIVLFWIIARFITNPMKRLMQSMRALQNGDFSQRVEFTGYDEIGRLGHLYNKMVGRIKLLIDDVYASSLKQREAELKALQSQINPHFLYNTLNMINWSAMQKNDQEISEMVVSLSQVFRLSLNSGNDEVELEQEIELVRHYLFLQKKRYPQRLHFEIEVASHLLRYRLPKLLLQPLVENAILHAIEPSEGPVNIHLSAYTENEWIIFEVTDNGPGIPEAQLAELKSGRTTFSPAGLLNNTRSGMALLNIKERLALFYDRSQFDIESKMGIGTRVQIRIYQGGKANGA